MTSTLAVGDRVLCYHGPKLYEAKILEINAQSDSKHYLVHYKGWKSKWDEWVGLDRIVAYNDNGLNLQKNLAQIHPGNEDQFVESTGSLSMEEDSSKPNEAQSAKPEVPVIFKVGKFFKFFSSNDWNMVTKQSKILAAPAQFSVAEFLQQYASQQSNPETKVFVDNIISYLNHSIGKELLYRQERLHYMSLSRNKPATSLYGPMILVRFFAQLNSILQFHAESPEIGAFTAEFSKLSDYLINYLRTSDLDAYYVEMSEHYKSIFTLS